MLGLGQLRKELQQSDEGQDQILYLIVKNARSNFRSKKRQDLNTTRMYYTGDRGVEGRVKDKTFMLVIDRLCCTHSDGVLRERGFSHLKTSLSTLHKGRNFRGNKLPAADQILGGCQLKPILKQGNYLERLSQVI